ncbi:hypothetical protein BURK2_01993 [Burkholderiales bacterium]|nr:hypothetical protein BURK2_01993 [Burkholderiales bacterium]
MTLRYRFTFEPDWRAAPMAFWVHVPTGAVPGEFEPAAPPKIPRRGYPFLRFEFREHELVFSSPAQLQHCIEVLAKNPLPTSRQLSAERGTSVGPNGHWLSRLPAELKSPRTRGILVRDLEALRQHLLLARPCAEHPLPTSWPVLTASGAARDPL